VAIDSKRAIRCPPNPEAKNDPYAKLQPYKYSQRVFKSFSDEEIKQQAGMESLTTGDKLAEGSQSQRPLRSKLEPSSRSSDKHSLKKEGHHDDGNNRSASTGDVNTGRNSSSGVKGGGDRLWSGGGLSDTGLQGSAAAQRSLAKGKGREEEDTLVGGSERSPSLVNAPMPQRVQSAAEPERRREKRQRSESIPTVDGELQGFEATKELKQTKFPTAATGKGGGVGGDGGSRLGDNGRAGSTSKINSPDRKRGRVGSTGKPIAN